MKYNNISKTPTKFKYILFSILMIIMSCGKEENEIVIATPTNEELIVTIDMIRQGAFIKTPKGYENMPSIELSNYIENLTIENHKQLSENYRISDYLITVGLLDKIEEKMNFGDLLTDIDFKTKLLEHQYTELQNHELSLATARSCRFIWQNCYNNKTLWYPKPYKRMFILDCNGNFHGYFIHLSEIIC